MTQTALYWSKPTPVNHQRKELSHPTTYICFRYSGFSRHRSLFFWRPNYQLFVPGDNYSTSCRPFYASSASSSLDWASSALTQGFILFHTNASRVLATSQSFVLYFLNCTFVSKSILIVNELVWTCEHDFSSFFTVWNICMNVYRNSLEEDQQDLFRVPRMARMRGDGFQDFLFELLLRFIPEVKVVGWPKKITQPPKHFYP